jgi:hypothetical protein
MIRAIRAAGAPVKPIRRKGAARSGPQRSHDHGMKLPVCDAIVFR